MPGKEVNRYHQLIEFVFFDPPYGYKPGVKQVPFARQRLEAAAEILGIKLPKNLGDILYSVRYRAPLPKRILDTQPDGMERVIES